MTKCLVGVDSCPLMNNCQLLKNNNIICANLCYIYVDVLMVYYCPYTDFQKIVFKKLVCIT